jgi:hypothetical protein
MCHDLVLCHNSVHARICPYVEVMCGVLLLCVLVPFVWLSCVVRVPLKVLLPGAASPRVVPFELQRVSLPSSLLVVRKKSREACACVLAVRVCPVPYDFLWMLERADTY